MRVLILTDSLGRPRPNIDEAEKTHYEDVYGYLLSNLLPSHFQVELHTFEGMDTDDAIEFNKKTVAFRSPDVVVYHLGINDCAPRIFKKGSNPFIFRPFIRKLTKRFFEKLIHKKRYSITKWLKRTYVPKNRFEQNLQQMIKEVRKYSPNCIFYAIEIAKPPSFLIERSFNMKGNITAYNEVMADVFQEGFIQFNHITEVEDRLISDGIHFSKGTHQLVADLLAKKIKLCVV